MENEPYAIWLDNFSKLYRVKMTSIQTGTMKTCLWTGIALKRFAYPSTVDLSHKRDEAGWIIPAMPTDPFEHMHVLKELLRQQNREHAPNVPKLYDGSLMRRWGAWSVPLTPDVKLMSAKLRESTMASNDRMSEFFPLGLEEDNIGSNTGLAKVLRRLYDRFNMGSTECKKYSVITVDVQIFDRILKVCRFFH